MKEIHYCKLTTLLDEAFETLSNDEIASHSPSTSMSPTPAWPVNCITDPRDLISGQLLKVRRRICLEIPFVRIDAVKLR